MSCLREVQTISQSPNILPMPSLTRLTTGGVLNPLKNTTKIGHNELLHQEPLQPPLEPRRVWACLSESKPTSTTRYLLINQPTIAWATEHCATSLSI